IRAALDQLLERDRGGRAADAGRAHRDGHAVELACPQGILAVLRDLLRLVKIARDLLAAPRVARQDDIAPDVALFNLNVHLFAVDQHTVFPSRSMVRMFFSALLRGSMTSCPQPSHLSLKSMPVRSTFHCLEPQGCGFFMVRMSPTCTSIHGSALIMRYI